MTDFLLKLMMYDDTYYKTVVHTNGVITSPNELIPSNIAELARAHDFHFEVERLSAFGELETFLRQL